MIQTFQDVERELKSIKDELDILRSRNIDLHQRRIINAHPSVDPYDYVIRKELLQQEEARRISTITQQQVTTLYDKATFGFSVSGSLQVATDVCPHYIFVEQASLIKCYAKIKVASTGGSVRIDVKKNGTSTIFGTTKLEIPESTLTVVERTGFAITSFAELNWLTADIVQVGSIISGGTLVVVLKFEI